jgi:outer membrane protein TolC
MFLSSALVTAAGCATNQKAEIATYRKELDGADPRPFVYHAGDPLTLEGAIYLANRNDEALASEGENYLQAVIDKERQFSTLFPSISLSPTYSWLSSRSGIGGAGTIATGTGGGGAGTGGAGGTQVIGIGSEKASQFDVPLVASYNVFNGFADISNIRRAGYTSQQQRALLLDLQQTTFLNVAQAYYTVLTNERSVVVLLNSVKVQNETVRDMQGRQRAGLARPLDVAQSEAQDAATRVQLIQAQNNVRTARIALAFLTNAPVQDAKLSDRLMVPRNLAPADDALKFAVRTRQDVQAGEAAVEAARQNVQAAIAQYYPSVTLNVDYFLHKESISTGTVWESLLTVNLPIFTFGEIDANVRQAWSQLRQTWLTDQRNHRTVTEQIRTAYENLTGSKLRIAELRIETSAAREALQQAQFSYQAGLATNLDVLTATQSLLTSQLALVTEELNYKVDYVQVLRSEGQIPRPDSGTVLSTGPTSQPAEDELTTPGPGELQTTNPSVPSATNPTTAPATTTNPSTAPPIDAGANNPAPPSATNPATTPATGATTNPAAGSATNPATTAPGIVQ